MVISLTGPADLVRLLVAYPLRWLVPAVLVVLAAGGYATLRPDTWEATQALIIRNEAVGNSNAPGKFHHEDEMKTLLETVLELAKSRTVLAQTLEEVGPPADRSSAEAWPSDEEIIQFSEAFKIAPPKGAEFGKTEVFYLKVQDRNRRRAMALATSLCNQLEARYNQVRDARAQGMVGELSKTVQLAQADLQASTGRLKQVEQQVGSDLAELRHLTLSGGGGESDLRRKSLELESELRKAVATQRNLTALLDNLEASLADQGQLLATPNGLLESQPALRKLKEGLLDAQLRTAQLLGTMSPVHPQVIAAREAEQEIRRHLRGELIVAIRGVELDRNLATNREQTLTEQLATLHERLELLAGLRAEYAGLVAEVEHRTKLLEESQRQLVEARASQSSALTASLISRLDAPTTGPRPVGPGRSMLLLAGIMGGPIFGLAILLISLPAAPNLAVRSVEPAARPAKRGLSLKQAPSEWSDRRPQPSRVL
jgi:uncharacterized protein involved in exopolysaccharide biosynthesis